MKKLTAEFKCVIPSKKFIFLGQQSILTTIKLPLLLREDTSLLFSNFGINPWPQIHVKNTDKSDVTEIIFHDQFEIILDGVILCQTDDFISALQVTFASYYIFNWS